MDTVSWAWRYRVSAGTGRPGVSILWLGEVESLICNFSCYFCAAAGQIVWADPYLRHTFDDVCWLVGCLTSQQHAIESHGWICSDNLTCCHTETEIAEQTFHLTQSQYTDTGPTSPSTDLITPRAWQGSHWSANFEVTGRTRARKNLGASGIRTRDLPLSRRTP